MAVDLEVAERSSGTRTPSWISAEPMPVPRVVTMTRPWRPFAAPYRDLGEPGGVRVVDDVHLAAGRVGEQPSASVPIHALSMFAADCDDAVPHHGRDRDADRAGPVGNVVDQLDDDLGDGVGRRRLGRPDPLAVGGELAALEVDRRALDAGAPEVDAEGEGSATPWVNFRFVFVAWSTRAAGSISRASTAAEVSRSGRADRADPDPSPGRAARRAGRVRGGTPSGPGSTRRCPPARTGRCATWSRTRGWCTGGPPRCCAASVRLDAESRRRGRGPVAERPGGVAADGAIGAGRGDRPGAPDDVEALVFLNDAPAPREFWARRQCHETTMHAVDALAASLGRPPRPDGGLGRPRAGRRRDRRAARRVPDPTAVPAPLRRGRAPRRTTRRR